jgi:hypothetical protein
MLREIFHRIHNFVRQPNGLKLPAAVSDSPWLALWCSCWGGNESSGAWHLSTLHILPILLLFTAAIKDAWSCQPMQDVWSLARLNCIDSFITRLPSYDLKTFITNLHGSFAYDICLPLRKMENTQCVYNCTIGLPACSGQLQNQGQLLACSVSVFPICW